MLGVVVAAPFSVIALTPTSHGFEHVGVLLAGARVDAVRDNPALVIDTRSVGQRDVLRQRAGRIERVQIEHFAIAVQERVNPGIALDVGRARDLVSRVDAVSGAVRAAERAEIDQQGAIV